MKIGDMVKAAYIREGIAGIYHTGIIVDISKHVGAFSKKYVSIAERNTYVKILSKGSVMSFEINEDIIKVMK
tara:strand:+ start:405 stop:620 length:216 start_codon:yes stop_codon:yes gene_type:complete